MVLGFALVLGAILLIIAGYTGRTVAETIRGTVGRGFAFADLEVPDISIQQEPASADSGGADTQFASLSGGGNVSSSGGAKGIVQGAAKIAKGFGVKPVSSHRPGATTTSGNVSDHSENNSRRAARDLSNARDAISGPPTPEMDAAVEAIGRAFGKRWNGKRAIVETFQWRGFQVQVIYRTPAYGGHMGHIHVGAHKA